MVRGRFMGFALVHEGKVNLLGLNDIGLFGLFVEDSVVVRLTLVEDGDVILSVQADHHGGMAHRIGGAFGLDLIDDLLELEGQVLGENARFLPGHFPPGMMLVGELALSLNPTHFSSQVTAQILREPPQVTLPVALDWKVEMTVVFWCLANPALRKQGINCSISGPSSINSFSSRISHSSF